jgi:hypothetical protein
MEVVTNALLAAGATNLALQLGRHIAGRGESTWETDGQVRLYLRRSDGRMFHRESIGRMRRLMARRGWIGSKRVMPTHVPDGAKHPSTYGTTSKWVAWDVIGVRNPLTKGQRKEQRKEHRREDRRHEVRPAPRGRTGPVAPVFAALVQGIGGNPQVGGDVNYKKGAIALSGGGVVKDRQRDAEARVAGIELTERPVSVRQSEAEAAAARQRAELAAWAAEHDPPDD